MADRDGHDRPEHHLAQPHAHKRIDWARIGDAILAYVETLRSNLIAAEDNPRRAEPSSALDQRD
jgi:hypothetical protein